tara:strand:- start:4602 stop:4946 length:345 start_codon:yes stop_codon:yes gene_type:complete
MVNSRSKGKRGELLWRDFLRVHLNCPDAKRGQQHAGGTDSPDVVGGIPGTHPEVKNTEKFSLHPAMQQAIQDAGDLIPYVAHKRNHKPWVIVVQASDLEAFCRSVVEHLDKDTM